MHSILATINQYLSPGFLVLSHQCSLPCYLGRTTQKPKEPLHLLLVIPSTICCGFLEILYPDLKVIFTRLSTKLVHLVTKGSKSRRMGISGSGVLTTCVAWLLCCRVPANLIVTLASSSWSLANSCSTSVHCCVSCCFSTYSSLIVELISVRWPAALHLHVRTRPRGVTTSLLLTLFYGTQSIHT